MHVYVAFVYDVSVFIACEETVGPAAGCIMPCLHDVVIENPTTAQDAAMANCACGSCKAEVLAFLRVCKTEVMEQLVLSQEEYQSTVAGFEKDCSSSGM